MVKNYSKPKFFPFPAYKAPRPSALRANQWAPQLISSAQTTSLYSQEPWKILDQSIEPISFRVTWCFKELVETYRAFKDRHRQALLKSTHLTSISSRQRKADPELAEFCEARRQRRSRSGHSSKFVLRFILQGMIDGYCDLDILLDPLFSHFPASSEKILWCPGLECKTTKIPNLMTALSLADSVEPWRNLYRSAIAKHPGSLITRISGKFFPC